MSLVTWAGAAMFLASLLHFLWRYFFTFDAPHPGPIDVTPVAFNCGLFSVFALHHSVLARTRAKAWINRTLGPDHERALFIWIASLLFVAVVALWRPVGGVLWNVGGWPALVIWAGQLGGVVMTAWSAARLGVLELAGIRLPSPQAPLILREDGPYGFVRHPIYFAWLLLVWCVPLMNGTRVTFAAISTLYLAIAIPFEERSLVGVFGPAYTRYQSRVRARMLPFIY